RLLSGNLQKYQHQLWWLYQTNLVHSYDIGYIRIENIYNIKCNKTYNRSLITAPPEDPGAKYTSQISPISGACHFLFFLNTISFNASIPSSIDTILKYDNRIPKIVSF